MSIREKVYHVIDDKDDLGTRLFDGSMTVLIILNVLAIVLESHDNIRTAYSEELYSFEVFSVIIFTIEFILRMLVADIHYNMKSYPKALLKYLTSTEAIIDLMAILPFYLPMVFKTDLRFIRVLRLARLFRVLKIRKYNRSFRIVREALAQSRSELLLTIFVCLQMLLFAAIIMYYAEHDAQPENFPNITASLWWSVITLTTVGYGDVYPITNLGRVVAGVIAFLGIGFIALPTGIISSAFMDKVNENKAQRKKNARKKVSEKTCKCPYCDETLKREDVKDLF